MKSLQMRLAALLTAIVIVLFVFDVVMGRSAGTLTFFVIVGLAFIWFPDEISDRAGFPSHSFSGGIGPTLITICGWAIYILIASIVLLIAGLTR